MDGHHDLYPVLSLQVVQIVLDLYPVLLLTTVHLVPKMLKGVLLLKRVL